MSNAPAGPPHHSKTPGLRHGNHGAHVPAFPCLVPSPFPALTRLSCAPQKHWAQLNLPLPAQRGSFLPSRLNALIFCTTLHPAMGGYCSAITLPACPVRWNGLHFSTLARTLCGRWPRWVITGSARAHPLFNRGKRQPRLLFFGVFMHWGPW